MAKPISINAKRIVVKVGTCVVCRDDGSFDVEAMSNLVDEIAELWDSGKDVLLVTSGAIANGMNHLGLKEQPHDVALQQACAAIGQPYLMSVYRELFSAHGINVAQVLLTSEYFNGSGRYAALGGTLESMLKARVLPIINENDAVSTRGIDPLGRKGIVFDDNDMLSAIIATTVKAEVLALLTNVDGFYDKNPHKNGDATLFSVIERITPEVEAMAGDAGEKGRGGMKRKVRAAKLATAEGVRVFVGNGKKQNILREVFARRTGTIFEPNPALIEEEVKE